MIDWQSATNPDGGGYEADPEGDKLIQFIPEDRRAIAEPMLRGYLGMLKANLGDDGYTTFCDNMQTAYAYFKDGDHENAKRIFDEYQIDYNIILSMATEQVPA